MDWPLSPAIPPVDLQRILPSAPTKCPTRAWGQVVLALHRRELSGQVAEQLLLGGALAHERRHLLPEMAHYQHVDAGGPHPLHELVHLHSKMWPSSQQRRAAEAVISQTLVFTGAQVAEMVAARKAWCIKSEGASRYANALVTSNL